ncbi:TetR/AcrR family transcriptional regulator [Mycolicibacterium phlei]|uniref:TetR family transcriptional regulator n=1 Tax=Mycolicibacterium phlei DSM 43239 = CCUG 21000 TaxID=1226750 RepID=A0A5N5V291_MYCPH|nr:TetR/AcrR family transcriptional regulator [Mycolicibacterium phlei]KAB7754739.1 TetR family transcriptional regulator [Mycolicibacterium phlei DSM 43239 = CCUG 21000]KXW65384.1 TetR family transcriptional regulator [Mycolicibacterium phlei DSM 43239 = CCUG 21000]KXW79030.1 hypothetical protein JL15_02915 [Mycolicibacterium phlei DSM 43071]
MARPRKPLISRRGVLEAALRIIDEGGLDSVSIRRLADELGVNGASLYHHFPGGKDEILIGAAQLALVDVADDPDPDLPWREWLKGMANRYRDALAAHPGIVPIAIRRQEVGMGTQEFEAAATRLLQGGLPSAAIVPLLDAIENFIVGSALHESLSKSLIARKEVPTGPVMTKVLKDAGLSAEEVFDLVIDSIIEGVENAIAEQVARWTPQPAGEVAQ